MKIETLNIKEISCVAGATCGCETILPDCWSTRTIQVNNIDECLAGCAKIGRGFAVYFEDNNNSIGCYTDSSMICSFAYKNRENIFGKFASFFLSGDNENYYLADMIPCR